MEESVEQHFQKDQTRQKKNIVNNSIKGRQRSYIYILESAISYISNKQTNKKFTYIFISNVN